MVKPIVVVMVGLFAVMAIPTYAQPQRPVEPADIQQEWMAMQGAANAEHTAALHVAEKLDAYITQAEKNARELDYWRRYFAGLSAKPTD